MDATLARDAFADVADDVERLQLRDGGRSEAEQILDIAKTMH